MLLTFCLLIAPKVWAGEPTYDEACRLRDEARQRLWAPGQSPLEGICDVADALDAAGGRYEAIALLMEVAEWMKSGSWAGDQAGVVLFVDRLLTYSELLEDGKLRVVALQVRSHESMVNGDAEGAVAAMRQALAEADRMGAPLLRADVLERFMGLFGQVLATKSGVDLREDVRDTLGALSADLSDATALTRFYELVRLGTFGCTHGDREAGIDAIRTALDSAVKARCGPMVGSALSALARQCRSIGGEQMADAVGRGRAALSAFEALLDRLPIVESLVFSCDVPPVEFALEADTILGALTDSSTPDTVCRVHLLLAVVANARGDDPTVAREVYEATRAAVLGGDEYDRNQSLRWVTEWATTVGRIDAVVDAITRCQGELPANFLGERWSLTEHVAKLKAAARGSTKLDPADLQPLRELLVYVPLDTVAHIREWLDLAHTYSDAGDPETAASLLAEVVDGAVRIGAPTETRLLVDGTVALVGARTAIGLDEAAAAAADRLVRLGRAGQLYGDSACVLVEALGNAGRTIDAQALCQTVLGLLEASHSASSTERLTELLAWSLLEQGRAEEAAALLPPVEVERDGSVGSRHRLWPLQAVCALAKEDIRTARTLMKDQPRGVDLLERLLLPLPDGEKTLSAGTLRRARFRALTAVSLLGATEAKPDLLGRAYLELGRIGVALHEYTTALGDLDRAQRLLGSAGPDTTRPLFALLAKAHEELGHTGAAAEYRELAGPTKDDGKRGGT